MSHMIDDHMDRELVMMLRQVMMDASVVRG